MKTKLAPIHFIQLSPNRLISTSNRFSLIKNGDYYQILMNSKLPKWSYKFSCVECAETFLNTHDYIKANTSFMPMSSDDIEYIIDMYGFNNVGHNKWFSDGCTLSIGPRGDSLNISKDDEKHTFNEAIDAIDYLDNVMSSTQFIKCSSLLEFKEYIRAASNNRSARDITRNLVRVKSSNIWAYAIDIKDRHDKTGTVYVQFKGKNGGPTGGLYCYYDVPITIWRRFISAPSKGHAFWVLIRNNYRYSKLDGDKRGKLRNAVN